MILDANILIGALDPADSHHQRVVDLLTQTAGAPLRTPELTLAECLVTPTRAGVETQALARLRLLGVQAIHLSDYAVELARIRAATGLRMPDALVVLAAERTAEPLTTFDDRLGKAARDRGIVVLDGAAAH